MYENRPTVLCKIVGVYQIGYHNRITGKRTMEQVAVMQVCLMGIYLTIMRSVTVTHRSSFLDIEHVL